jgi:HSP20 family protein
MASEKSRQQTSERAQTSSPSAQQGDWQSTQRSHESGAGGQRSGEYPSTQQSSRTGLSTRGTSSVPGYYGGFGGSGPFALMRRISDEMDRMFENFGMGRGFFPAEFGQGGMPAYGGGESMASLWSPHVEISERDGKLLISADLPGVKKEDVNIQVNPDAVTIHGKRNEERSTNERGYYHSERIYGSFSRTIPLPEGAHVDAAKASFKDGVLSIEVPVPQQSARGRTLEINDGSSSRSGSTGQS